MPDTWEDRLKQLPNMSREELKALFDKAKMEAVESDVRLQNHIYWLINGPTKREDDHA